MAVERTLSIIKPDAVAKNVIGKIYSRFESNGLRIVAAQMHSLSQAEAEGFYAVQTPDASVVGCDNNFYVGPCREMSQHSEE